MIAQNNTDSIPFRHNAWGITAVGGLHQFYGDISDNTFFPGSSLPGKYNWQAGLQGRFDLNPKFGARLDLSTGEIWAEHYNTKNYFGSKVQDANLVFLLNLTNITMPYWYDKWLDIDLGFGAGYFTYQTDYRKADGTLLDHISMSYAPMWSIHGSIAYRMSKHWDLSMQVSLKNTPVDDIDGVKNTLTELDKYSNVSLGITYTFGKNDQAYRWNPKPMDVQRVEQTLYDLEQRTLKVEEFCEDTKIGETDSDHDGVPDSKDVEPDSRPGSYYDALGRAIGPIGLVDSLGRPLNVKVVGHTKNSTNTQTNTSTVNTNQGNIFLSSIYFAFDKSDALDSLARFTIYNIAVYMKYNPNSSIVINGNTDPKGTNEYNKILSELRCKRIQEMLIFYGIDKIRIRMQPFGEEKIMFPEKVNEANRRVDILFVQ